MSRPVGSKNKEVEKDLNAESKAINSTSVPVEQIKVVNVPIENLENQIKNLESRIGEIEGFRNPNALDTRVRAIQENLDAIDTRLQKVEALLKKAYSIEDDTPEIVKLKGNAGTANIARAINAVRGTQDGVPKPTAAPKVSV